jgi:hypothetical protein
MEGPADAPAKTAVNAPVEDAAAASPTASPATDATNVELVDGTAAAALAAAPSAMDGMAVDEKAVDANTVEAAAALVATDDTAVGPDIMELVQASDWCSACRMSSPDQARCKGRVLQPPFCDDTAAVVDTASPVEVVEAAAVAPAPAAAPAAAAVADTASPVEVVEVVEAAPASGVHNKLVDCCAVPIAICYAADWPYYAKAFCFKTSPS